MKTTAYLFFFTCLLCLGSCVNNNLLLYKYKRFYWEENIWSCNSTITFEQSIHYNKPRVIDESYTYHIFIELKDIDAAKKKSSLDVKTDSMIISCSYDLSSVWNWEAEKYALSGNIKILDWNSNRIKIKENIMVRDFNQEETLLFKGRRTFRKEDEKGKLHSFKRCVAPQHHRLSKYKLRCYAPNSRMAWHSLPTF